MFRDHRRQLVHIHHIVRFHLVGAAVNKAQLLRRHTHRVQERRDDELVVFRPVLEHTRVVDFQRIEAGMEVCYQHALLAARGEELGDLHGGDCRVSGGLDDSKDVRTKISAMRLASWCRS